MNPNEIISKEFVNTHIVSDDTTVDTLKYNVQETDELSKRAYAELVVEGLIDTSLPSTEEMITISTGEGKQLVKSRYIYYDDIAYFNWIWTTYPIPDTENDVGTKLVQHTLEKLTNDGVSKVYIFPQSRTKRSFYKEQFDFESTENVPEGYLVKQL